MKQNTSLANQYLGFIETPSLFIDDTVSGFPRFEFSLIDDIPVLDDMVPLNLMLGKRAERFFENTIKQSTRYKLLGKNLQIQKGKSTLGELDFLVENLTTKEHLHVELVYKFYLYDPSSGTEELNNWIGPNKSDSLSQKLWKLKEKQFPLLFSEETGKLLRGLGLDVLKIKQCLCFKAQLFVPLNLLGEDIPKINNECIVGNWVSQDEFTSEEYGDFQFFVPEKQDWFVNPEDQTEWTDYYNTREVVIRHLKERRAPMVWVRKTGNIFKKLFVVWW